MTKLLDIEMTHDSGMGFQVNGKKYRLRANQDGSIIVVPGDFRENMETELYVSGLDVGVKMSLIKEKK